MTTPTGFYLHPSAALHDPGWRHPEHQGRLRAVSSKLGRVLPELGDRVVQGEPGEASEADLLRVHDSGLLEQMRDAVDRARESEKTVTLDADTAVSGASWDAAVGSAGTAIAACREVAGGSVRNAFVATRPPGHHATPDRAMGFCLFNHVAVAARRLQADGLAERILVVDWDVHHGNGTQDIFYDDPSVFYLSLHQSPHYPGTGSAEERGAGEAEGTTLNVPLPPGTPRERYREAFDRGVEEVISTFSPDFLLVSSGFDVLAGDPLGGQLLEPEDLGEMTVQLREWSEEAFGGRMAVLLEGGYAPERLADGVAAVLRGLCGADDLSGEDGV
ncbi:MAG: histone deacetylase [Longimicrobiales bacterium]|nr:histone deacetylase [Longimicrobiales bacterium]